VGFGVEADASLPCSIELACDGSGEEDQLSVEVSGALLHRLLLSPHQRFSISCPCCAFEKLPWPSKIFRRSRLGFSSNGLYHNHDLNFRCWQTRRNLQSQETVGLDMTL
jgi:hypothetical protein